MTVRGVIRAASARPAMRFQNAPTSSRLRVTVRESGVPANFSEAAFRFRNRLYRYRYLRACWGCVEPVPLSGSYQLMLLLPVLLRPLLVCATICPTSPNASPCRGRDQTEFFVRGCERWTATVDCRLTVLAAKLVDWDGIGSYYNPDMMNARFTLVGLRARTGRTPIHMSTPENPDG